MSRDSHPDGSRPDADMDADAEAVRVQRIVCGVAEAAVAATGAAGLLVLDHGSPEGRLVGAWFEVRFGADRVHRGDAVAGNVRDAHATASSAQTLEEARQRDRLIVVHPVNRTMLLLGGAPPLADLLPLGDVPASWIAHVQRECTLSDEVAAVAGAAGGVDALDAMLADWVDARMDPDRAFSPVGTVIAGRIIELYERGRFFRLRPRLVPKLGPRTVGIDLWD